MAGLCLKSASLICVLFLTDGQAERCGLLSLQKSVGTEMKSTSTYSGISTPDYSFDLERIGDFFTTATVNPFSSDSGEVQKCCRRIKWTSAGRVHSVMEPLVYDCVAEDEQTGISVLVSHRCKSKESREAAMDALMYHLRLLEVLKDRQCTIDHYSPLLDNINGKCASGTTVICDTVCEFACAEENARLTGSSSITCCENGTFSSSFPLCEEPSFRRRITTVTEEDVLQTTTQISSDGVTYGKVQTTNSYHTIPVTRPHNYLKKINLQKGFRNIIYANVLTIGFLILLIGVPSLVNRFRKRRKAQLIGGKEGISPDSDGYYLTYALKKATPTVMQVDPSENYKMDGIQKGSIFILNNNNFSDDVGRIGSDIDATNLAHVFKEIGYKPHVEKNLTSQEIKRKLVELRNGIDSRDTSVVLFLMTRGHGLGIHGVDGNAINVEEIKDLFRRRYCPALQNKPKIIFIQTIRPHLVDLSPLAGDCASNTVNTDIQHPRLKCETNAFCTGSDDIFAVDAETQGYSSMRLHVNGSWFIQILCEELILKAHNENLDYIMTGVTRRVATIPGVKLPQITKQGICKRIFFLPKYSTEPGRHIEYSDDDDNLDCNDVDVNLLSVL